MQPRPAILVLLEQFTEEHPGWAGLCWLSDAAGQAHVEAEQGLSRFVIHGTNGITPSHQQRVSRVLQDGETLTADHRQDAQGLRPHVAYLAGLRRAGVVVGVIELLAPPTVDPERSGGRPTVEQLADRLSRLLHQDDALPPPTAAFWEE